MATLRQYEYFLAVADLKHFGKAAEACHVSQPTLSMQLKELEERLGASLIERRKKNVLLTPLGQRIYPEVKALLNQADTILSITNQTMAPLTSELSLGVIPTVATHLLPHLIPPVHKKFPQLKLYLREDQTHNILAKVNDGAMDLGLLALMDFDPAKFVSYPLFEEEFVVALPDDDPLLRKKAIMPDDLRSGNKLLLLEQGHCLRDQALDVCQFSVEETQGANFQATSLETLKQMVASGLGRTVLPALAAEEGRGYHIRPFFKPEPMRKIGFVWRRSSARQDELELLAKSILESVPNGRYTPQ